MELTLTPAPYLQYSYMYTAWSLAPLAFIALAHRSIFLIQSCIVIIFRPFCPVLRSFYTRRTEYTVCEAVFSLSRHGQTSQSDSQSHKKCIHQVIIFAHFSLKIKKQFWTTTFHKQLFQFTLVIPDRLQSTSLQTWHLEAWLKKKTPQRTQSPRVHDQISMSYFHFKTTVWTLKMSHCIS